DGSASDTGLSVINANEASTNGASDPMYGSYLYSDGGNITVTVANLSQGVYDFISTDTGMRTTMTAFFSSRQARRIMGVRRPPTVPAGFPRCGRKGCSMCGS